MSDASEKPQNTLKKDDNTRDISNKATSNNDLDKERHTQTLKRLITSFENDEKSDIATDSNTTESNEENSESTLNTDETIISSRGKLAEMVRSATQNASVKPVLPLIQTDLPTSPVPFDDTQGLAPVHIDDDVDLPTVIDSQEIEAQTDALAASPKEAPWALQQFFNGEIDLDVELNKRFPAMPMMSIIKFRTLGTKSGRHVATITSQDKSASLVVDADKETKTVLMSFTVGSMLTLRFTLAGHRDMDRDRWLELMRREQGGLAFLWGSARWEEDYLICIARKYHTNLYAFSPHQFEAAIRLTPQVTKQLLDWLQDVWEDGEDENEDPPTLLTW